MFIQHFFPNQSLVQIEALETAVWCGQEGEAECTRRGYGQGN